MARPGDNSYLVQASRTALWSTVFGAVFFARYFANICRKVVPNVHEVRRQSFKSLSIRTQVTPLDWYSRNHSASSSQYQTISIFETFLGKRLTSPSLLLLCLLDSQCCEFVWERSTWPDYQPIRRLGTSHRLPSAGRSQKLVATPSDAPEGDQLRIRILVLIARY